MSAVTRSWNPSLSTSMRRTPAAAAPARSPARVLFRREGVLEPVIVDVDEAYAGVRAVREAEGSELPLKPLVRFPKVEEFHLAPVFLVDVVDEVDHLLGPDPPVGMEHEVEHAPLP